MKMIMILRIEIISSSNSHVVRASMYEIASYLVFRFISFNFFVKMFTKNLGYSLLSIEENVLISFPSKLLKMICIVLKKISSIKSSCPSNPRAETTSGLPKKVFCRAQTSSKNVRFIKAC